MSDEPDTVESIDDLPLDDDPGTDEGDKDPNG